VKIRRIAFLRSLATFCLGATVTLTVLVLFVATASVASHAQVQVTVPGNASGGFGNGSDQVVPLVPSITVSGPATITVTATGSVNGVGPDGFSGCYWENYQKPLQEAHDIQGGCFTNAFGLIGAFIPQTRVQRTGFKPVDATKNIAWLGIMPGRLFFIGESKTFTVTEAGTLFLGINDEVVFDNSGSFDVTVTAP
jgi:hypothetical protein